MRSLLFVPGTRPEWVPKAVAAGADAVILDLEDAVHPDARTAARHTVAESVARHRGEIAVFVRVNALDTWTGAEDVRRVVAAGPAGVVLPKVSGTADVLAADRLIGWTEAESGRPVGSTVLLPLLETAAGLYAAERVARAAARVGYLGAVTGRGGDVQRAVGYGWDRGGGGTAELRARVLLDARAGGVRHPVAGLWTDISDLAGLRGFAEHNLALGYEGMLAIHPSHVPVLNEVFGPDERELEYLRRLVRAMEEARERGANVTVFEGDMVDEAMLVTARRRLAAYGG
ncbi:CoA ester lyase [Marinitenerispora sediminis]|uniref:CoA ester lyase n=1 Tax=Marinitenerispora sediminis TaxID=1931232 RepID=A0A368T025_9ACTN|nr:CoA ester lyase [Marinitenerispora sediminis]RCV51985.1 CoA ester lyase [Marinitenerispora sediminis]RCV52106.1 CoA ester lyase [Marinitenerispora sediminis]